MIEQDVRHMTPEEFRRRGREMIDFLADYWAALQSAEPPQVTGGVKPGALTDRLPMRAPERGEPWDAVMADVRSLIVPGLMHWQHPSFFGYFPANGSGPGVLGDLLSTGLGVNGMLWATSPAATELETRVLDWMARACGLPEAFLSTAPPVWGETRPGGGGVIQGTASEATLVALLAARHRARGMQMNRPLVMYCTNQSHSSIMKAAMIAGLACGPEDHRHVRFVATRADHSMDPDALRKSINTDLAGSFVPFFVAATLGTTSSMAYDDLDAIGGVIGSVVNAGPIWLHVDAAMAGSAWICPEHRGQLRGVEHASSVSFNPHKWLLTNFDCGLFWTRDRSAVTGALSITPEYLKTGAGDGVIDYRDWQVPLGRRFRSLKLWMVLRHYGLEGLRAHVRNHLELASWFELQVKGDRRLELCAPREKESPLVCFRLRGAGESPKEAAELDARNRAFHAAINGTGKLYLSHTTLIDHTRPMNPPRYVLRMAIGGTFTKREHVEAAWRVIAEMAGRVTA